MIKHLRKKLVFTFLAFTMSAYTLLLGLMAADTVRKAQSSELAYARQLANRIAWQLQEGNPLTKQDYTYYAASKIWVCLSDSLGTHSGPECFPTATGELKKQILSRRHIIEMEEITSTTLPGSSLSYTACLLSGSSNDQYYGIKMDFSTGFQENLEALFLIVPRSSAWGVLQKNCRLYPFLWLFIFALMYVMSRLLIQKSILPIESAIKSQKEFTAAASHELKTPLAVIQANAEALELTDSNQQKQTVILEECDRMSRLVQSLLSLAAGDSGSFHIHIRETDLDTILIEAWEAFLAPCKKNGLTLNLKLAEQDAPKIFCDPERIIQLLGILLDNAISFSPSGSSIELGGRIWKKYAELFVIDHGPGIPYEKKRQVWKRFYCGDASRTDRHHFGLGLSIAEEIVKQHHGRLELADTPGGGCTVRVAFNRNLDCYSSLIVKKPFL